jgi:hypothetical protein
MGEPNGAKEASTTIVNPRNDTFSTENKLSSKHETQVDRWRKVTHIPIIFEDSPTYRFVIIETESDSIRLVPSNPSRQKGRLQWGS